MRCRLCRYMQGINEMYCYVVYVGNFYGESCVGICGINEM